MKERIRELAEQAGCKVMDGEWYIPSATGLEKIVYTKGIGLEKFAELILANADELKRMLNTDPINKPFELNPKFVAKCDEIGRSRRQFQ
jgi:hypothetical protein